LVNPQAAERAIRIDPAVETDRNTQTHARVQLIPLAVCAMASAAMVPATHLAWFGSLNGDLTVPRYGAISGMLVPPSSPAGLVPGTQSWGYLLIFWSAVVAVLAVVAAFSRVLLRARRSRGVSGLLATVGVASLILMALVVAELMTSVPFDLAQSHASADWGAIVGLGLALVSSIGAWLAWATWKYPHRWGLDPST
jgi:hypothetical protein